MKIQLITARRQNNYDQTQITVSEFAEPMSLDEFDVNIIDLGANGLWQTKNRELSTIDRIKDFDSLQSMVIHRSKALIVYVFPQNIVAYSNTQNKSYMHNSYLKDNIDFLTSVVLRCFPHGALLPSLLYEKTNTIIGSRTYKADFYFDNGNDPISQSNKSEKTTTDKCEDYLYITTLDICNTGDALVSFVNSIIPQTNYEDIPEWIKSIEFFNDRQEKDNIVHNEEIIKQAQRDIDASKRQLKENNYYKSILYTNGEQLVKVVFSILEKILSCDLSNFMDKKEEDFIIKKTEYTLVGEIKGVNSNIKNEHVSQVDVHYQSYIDKTSEENIQESVHQVLIINSFRNKPLSEREPVNEKQIHLAERNGCLIIQTVTLLKLYERFIFGEVSSSFCEKLFTEKKGLLKEEDFSKS